ncbi:MAG: FIMAH domain-containing protein, partial [Candidatus Acidiferrales bacterium]
TIQVGAFPFGIAITPVIPPRQGIQKLVNDVLALNLKRGISNSFDSKLQAALQVLDDMNENNNAAAINVLHAFINSVEAQRGVHISDADADGLIATAQAIIAQLTGP